MKKGTRKCAPQLIAEERRAMKSATTKQEVEMHYECACKIQASIDSACIWKDCRYCKFTAEKNDALDNLARGITINVTGGNVTVNIRKDV